MPFDVILSVILAPLAFMLGLGCGIALILACERRRRRDD